MFPIAQLSSSCSSLFHTLMLIAVLSLQLDTCDELYKDAEDHDNDNHCHLAADGKTKREQASDKVLLHPFGLSTYKMQGDLWVKPDTCEQVKFMELQDAAHSWVKQLGVCHHDLNFFDHHWSM